MLQQHMAVCIVATTLMAAPALAQTSPAPTSPSSPATQPAAPAGSTTAPAAAPQGTAAPVQGSQIQYIAQDTPDLWRASKLKGVNIYNEQNEKIGDISEVMVDRQGRVKAVVIGVGGFLGMGQHDVAVPFDALQWVKNEPAATGTAAPAAPAGTVNGQVAPAPATAPAAQTNAGTALGTAPGTASAPATNAQTDLTRDYPARAVLAGASKDQLKAAPEFKYAR